MFEHSVASLPYSSNGEFTPAGSPRHPKCDVRYMYKINIPYLTLSYWERLMVCLFCQGCSSVCLKIFCTMSIPFFHSPFFNNIPIILTRRAFVSQRLLIFPLIVHVSCPLVSKCSYTCSWSVNSVFPGCCTTYISLAKACICCLVWWCQGAKPLADQIVQDYGTNDNTLLAMGSYTVKCACLTCVT